MYPARRDWWAKIVIAPLLLSAIGAGAWIVYSGMALVQVPSVLVIQWLRPAHELMMGVALVAIAAALLCSLLAGRYQLAEPELVVHTGIDHRRVPLGTVVDVVPTRWPFRRCWTRAPAWSRDAFCVIYLSQSGSRSSIVVAPDDRQGFLDALARAAPQLHRSDDGGLHVVDLPNPPSKTCVPCGQ